MDRNFNASLLGITTFFSQQTYYEKKKSGLKQAKATVVSYLRLLK
jgi:hypothetical protein